MKFLVPTSMFIALCIVGFSSKPPPIRTQAVPPPIYILTIDHAHHYVQTCQQIRWTTSGDITQRPNIAEFGEPCVADTIFYDGMESR